MPKWTELKVLVEELCGTKAEWSERAESICKRGFEPFPPRGLNEKDTRRLLTQLEYFNLSEPAFEFVKWLQINDCLKVLAEHAELDPARPSSEFPFVIPVVPRLENPHHGWDPESASDRPQPTANARLLLWLAVAHTPEELGHSEWLFQQKLLRFLPACEEPGSGRIHPVRRIQRWVGNAATAIFRELTLQPVAVEQKCLGFQAQTAGSGEAFRRPLVLRIRSTGGCGTGADIGSACAGCRLWSRAVRTRDQVSAGSRGCGD